MKNHSISVDFGGTMVKLALFNNNELIDFNTYDSTTEKSMAEILGAMKEVVDERLQEHGLTYDDCRGIGIAMPGIVNFKDRTLISINKKYMNGIGYDFCGWIRQNMGLEAILENDANAALLGERAVGTLKGADYAALLILGTGVGTAAMMEGRLLRGAHNQAGCLGGHIIVDYKGRACNCGSIGCIEAQASTWVLPDIIKTDKRYPMSTLQDEKELRIKQLVEHARNGDPLAAGILSDFIQKWSAGVINLVHAYDPEVVVLSGGIIQAGDIIIKPLIERVQQFAWTPYGTIDIVVSQNPDQSVLYGMNAMVKEYL